MHYEKFADGTVKCIEDEIPFEVPEGWAWCRLSDLFFVCSAKRVLQSDWKTEGVPFYRAREIVKLAESGIVENELFISEEHYQDMIENYGIPQENDLMVSAVGTIGKIYIVKDQDRFYYKDASVICFKNTNNIINSKYAKIMLESSFLQQQMISNSKGTTVDTITISTAQTYLCALPPLNEQINIVLAVEKVLTSVNGIKENKDELKSLIRNIKSKILDLAIRGKLVPQDPNDEPASVLLERIRAEKEELIKQGKIKRDKKESIIFRGEDNSYYEKIGDEARCIDEEIPFEIPENWSWCRLSHIFEIIMGSSPNSTDICDDEQYIEFHQGKICFTDRIISGSGQFTKSITKIASPNSVLLCVRAPVGEVNITDRNICIGRGLASLKPYKEISEIFLFYWLQALKSRLVEKATGTTFIAVTTDVVKDLIIPLPSHNSQISIIKTIEEIISRLSQLEKSLN